MGISRSTRDIVFGNREAPTVGTRSSPTARKFVFGKEHRLRQQEAPVAQNFATHMWCASFYAPRPGLMIGDDLRRGDQTPNHGALWDTMNAHAEAALQESIPTDGRVARPSRNPCAAAHEGLPLASREAGSRRPHSTTALPVQRRAWRHCGHPRTVRERLRPTPGAPPRHPTLSHTWMHTATYPLPEHEEEGPSFC